MIYGTIRRRKNYNRYYVVGNIYCYRIVYIGLFWKNLINKTEDHDIIIGK